MQREAIPGKTMVSLDLPKAAHALVFDRHATMVTAREQDALRVAFHGDGRKAEILLDDASLAMLLKLIATDLEGGGKCSDQLVRHQLETAARRLAAALSTEEA